MARTLAAFGFAAFTATIVNAATIVPAAPVLENKGFVLMDYDSGQVLASSNPDQRLAPASLTKMMTSFLVEQRLIKGTLKETDPVLMS